MSRRSTEWVGTVAKYRIPMTDRHILDTGAACHCRYCNVPSAVSSAWKREWDRAHRTPSEFRALHGDDA